MMAVITSARRSILQRQRPSDWLMEIRGHRSSQTDYVNAVAAAADSLQRERLLLDEDVSVYVEKAKAIPWH